MDIKRRIIYFPTISDNNMAKARTCEAEAEVVKSMNDNRHCRNTKYL